MCNEYVSNQMQAAFWAIYTPLVHKLHLLESSELVSRQ